MSANPPGSVIEATWGPYVTGIMMQQLLMGVFVVQVYDYARLFERDPGYIKGLVAALAIATTLQATMDYVSLYRCAVRFFAHKCPFQGNFDMFDLQDWSLWWEIAVTAMIGSIAQVFFLIRCWAATKSKIVVAIGGAAIVTSLVSGIVSTVRFQQITAVIDVSIALVLVISLLRMKTPFRKTEAIITKMIRVTMETSSVTAAIAVINLILYLALPGLAYHLLPQLIMGKLYAISVMVTLGSRKELREIAEEADHASYITSIQTGPVKSTGSGIKVTKTTTVGDPNARDIELGDRKNVPLHPSASPSEEDVNSTYDDRKRRF
ncbi:hypothetical protein EXIGLDRAFT_694575 [Exidia glandulosa HHB12029]|uniref:DUF6534 domain-containing protein n=1 Tax=Exidia glandulosa HHB12029 TaxID=1314781 RepID=A0A165GI57_EXIGL|nr:hypothetical protein EXIGLDRAFT_694575 [Exidia glandulosa HHB12029]